jgi:hypothetical protein
MFLKISKSNQPFLVLLVPLVGVLFWLKTFLGRWPDFPFDYSSDQMPLFSLVYNFLQKNQALSDIVSFFMILISAFLINRLNLKFILIPERSYLPSIFYVLLVSSFYKTQTLNPALFSSFFLLLAVERLLDSYKLEHLAYNIFDAALLIGLGSLFHFTVIFFVAYIWAALLILRPFYWREWLYSVLGIIVPYIFLFGIYFVIRIPFEKIWEPILYNFKESNHLKLHYGYLIQFGYFTLVMIIASIHMMQVLSSIKILARRAFNMFLFFFLLSVAIPLIIPAASFEWIYVTAIPISFLLSHYFSSVRSNRVNELLFDLIIFIMIAVQIIMK